LAALTFLALSIALYAQGRRPADPSPTTGPVGSFQILAGRYATEGIGATGAVDTEGIFRIDTRTGKIWIYMTGTDNRSGKSYEGWGPVSEAITYSK
jgi:uncharacterized membrane protein